MLVVVALGGNALLRRGEPITADRQRACARVAAKSLASIAVSNQLVIAYGNGPQAALLALQGAAYTNIETYPYDPLNGQCEGTIGYMIEQELGNLLPCDRAVSTMLTMVEVDPADPAFKKPTKFIGPLYLREEAERLSKTKGWVFKPDGDKWRRVVASPEPKRIFELRPIKWLLEHDTVVITAGGGGIPAMYVKGASRRLTGVECMIDKDLASELLARELGADLFIMLTDAEAVCTEWERSTQRAIRRASPSALAGLSFAAGSMGSKVDAARRFAVATGNPAAIGALAEVDQIVAGEAGTTISVQENGISYATGAGPMVGVS
jgi:carbamate kinase